MSQNTPLLVAQITDTHLFANPNQEMLGTATAKSFQAVLERVKRLEPQPDLLLLTGDLSQDETPESYQYLQTLLSPLSIPTYWIPGNHDSLAIAQQVLTQKPVLPHKSFQLGGWQFILLNSAVPGCVDGELSSPSLEWLEQQLQLAGNPTLISLHHPPLAISSDWMDKIGLQNPKDLFAVVDHHPQVRLVIFGHIHQEFEGERQGVHYLGSPSTCVQFVPQNRELVLEQSLPGFRLLRLYPNGTWETQVERAALVY